jgi:long-chain acyl-CoA synthetase
VRVGGNRLGGIVVQETESDYVITLSLFTDKLDVDDFLEVIWVPPEIRDRIVEPLTSIREETGTVVTHDMFRGAVESALREVMKVELNCGKLTRDESFAQQRRKGLSKR